VIPPAGRRRDRPRERSPRGDAAVPQDIFLQSPPEPRTRRLGSLISRRARNFLLAAAVPIAAVVGVFSMLPSTDEVATARAPVERATPPDPAPHPAKPADADLRSYAVSATEVAGLSIDTTPGTRMELWVAWQPPVTKEPRVQRLVEEVVLEKIVPPTVSEAPPTAVLLIAPKSVDEVIYGDLYGRLSAVTLNP
jgi:hypothetical protein